MAKEIIKKEEIINNKQDDKKNDNNRKSGREIPPVYVKPKVNGVRNCSIEKKSHKINVTEVNEQKQNLSTIHNSCAVGKKTKNIYSNLNTVTSPNNSTINTKDSSNNINNTSKKTIDENSGAIIKKRNK